MKIQIVLAVIIALVLAATIYFGRTTARSVAGETILPVSTDFSFFLPETAADATLHLHTDRPIPAHADLFLDLRHGVLSEQPKQTAARESAGLVATVTQNRGLTQATGFPFGDWGTFAALRTGTSVPGLGSTGDSNDSGRFLVGLRSSPLRLLYGTVAPDLLLAPYDAGVGLSFYAPDLWNKNLAHWGIGFGRLFSLARGGTSTNVAYLAFSTWDN